MPKKSLNKKANKMFRFLFWIHLNEFSITFLDHLSATSKNIIAFLVHLSVTSINKIKNAAMISQTIPLRTVSIIQPTNIQSISIVHIVFNVFYFDKCMWHYKKLIN